jgi:hypothetical protein
LRAQGLIDALRRPENRPLWLAAAVGLLIGLGAGALFIGGKSPDSDEKRRGDAGGPRLAATGELEQGEGRDGDAGPSRAAARRALQDGITRANALGGSGQAAIWVDGWDAPVVVGGGRTMRMWSMSKPVVALAALLEPDARERDPGLSGPIRDAITQSDNCAIRRVTLSLQEMTGGPEGARSAFNRVLADAEVLAQPIEQQAPAEPTCHPYLRDHAAGLDGDPLGEAVRFGTAEWTLENAIRFAHELPEGTYGDAGREILELMREPKERSPNIRPDEFTADLDFGAGAALSEWEPAYKAGWGGYDQGGPYLVGQIVVVETGWRDVALAAVFHPTAQPPTDDPGLTPGPVALETMFQALEPVVRAAAEN